MIFAAESPRGPLSTTLTADSSLPTPTWPRTTSPTNDNDSPRNAGSHLKDAWVAAIARSRNGSTNPSAVPHQRLDHVLIPHGWTSYEVRVPDPTPEWEARSDHLPVFVIAQMRSK
ncbi:MAG: hypothetical protein EBX95_01075 [Acidimicrobiia bacterium]|nr:hypothetical protein [Acidimicrobiia bacterium]